MFNAPLSITRADYLLSLFEFSSLPQVVDIGCGDGKFLQRFARQHVIEGVGVDYDSDLIHSATDTWSKITSDSNLKFNAEDATAYLEKLSPVDVMICVGAEYAVGGYAQLLDVAKTHLKTNGKLLVGTIYWKQPPSDDYLSLMGGENPHFDLHTTVQMAYQMGYVPLDVGRSNDDEWDQFESRSNRRHYQNNKQWDKRWQWQSGYLKWGMNTMGFCFLLLEKAS